MSSLFDLDEAGQKALASEARLNPLDASQIEPSFMTGAAKGAAMGVMKGEARLGQLAGLAGALVPMAADVATGQPMDADTSRTRRYFSAMDAYVNKAADYWTPSADEVGKAGQILGGFGELVAPTLLSGGNPTLGAALVGGTQGAGTGIDLSRQGVDLPTAAAAAATQGAAAAVGFRLPFLGTTLLSRIGSGIGFNVGLDIGSKTVTQQILQARGYDRQARGYDPLDPTAISIDVMLGALFGGVAHVASPHAAPRSEPDLPTPVPEPTPASEVAREPLPDTLQEALDLSDAANAAANAKHYQQDTAPGVPLDEVSSAIHQKAMDHAMAQMLADQPVTVTEDLSPALFQAPAPEPVMPDMADALPPAPDLEMSAPDAPPSPQAEAPTAQPVRKSSPKEGSITSAVTERGTRIETRYRVQEINSLITSHHDSLQKNPLYPAELQPRDRSRAASEAQIAKIQGSINPELLAESPKASDGAPIIGADGVVESGNARTIALRRAYEAGQANDYKAWLRANAERFGLDKATVKRMKKPVLVRMGLGEYDRAEFARQANESAVAQMSLTEQAQADAARLHDLTDLAVNEDGSINMSKSGPFVRQFLAQAVGPTEHGAMMTADGQLSQQGLNRIRHAIFAKAYGDPELTALLTESTDANVKNILNGMMRAAGEVARLQDLVQAGARHDLHFTGALADAVRVFSQLRRDGMTVDQYLAQQGLFDSGPPPIMQALLKGLEQNSRSAKRIGEMIGRMADAVDRLGDPSQQNLFGEAMPIPAPHELVSDAVKSVRDAYDIQSSDDLFHSPTVAAALQVVNESPDMRVVLDDGSEVSAREAVARAQDAIIQSEHDAKAFDAALLCHLGSE